MTLASKDPLIERIEQIVDRRLEERLAGFTTGGTFDSDRLPINVTKRTFITLCRSGDVAGAVKRGRLWTCTREAWFKARAPKPKAPPALRLVTTSDDDALAEAALAGAGLRSTRGAR